MSPVTTTNTLENVIAFILFMGAMVSAALSGCAARPEVETSTSTTTTTIASPPPTVRAPAFPPQELREREPEPEPEPPPPPPPEPEPEEDECVVVVTQADWFEEQTARRVIVLRWLVAEAIDSGYHGDYEGMIAANLAMRELVAEWVETASGEATPTADMTAAELIEHFLETEETDGEE